MVKTSSLNLLSKSWLNWPKYGLSLAALVSLLVFVPSLAAWFSGEDFSFVLPASTGKPFYQTWQNLFYRPLPNLLWQFDYAVWGLNAPGYHLTNLVLHAANVWLVGWLVRKTDHSEFAGVVAAALFALTPVHIEPVVWLAGRPDLLATFFSLLSLVAMQHFFSGSNRLLYAASVIAFGAAIFSKEAAAGIPLVLIGLNLLTEGWPGRGAAWRGFALKYLPFVAVEAVYWLVRYGMLGSLGSYGNDGLLNIAWNLTIGLWQPLLFPFNFESAGWLGGGLLSAVLLFFYGWLATAFFRPSFFKNQLRNLAGPVLLMYGGLAPALTLAPVGLNLSQSRLLYLPSVGFCLLLAWLFHLKLLEIKKTAPGPGGTDQQLSDRRNSFQGGVELQKLLLAIIPGLVYLAGLGFGLSPWLQAGSEAKATFDQLQRAGLPFRAGDYIYYEGLPDSFQGAYIWRNGLGEASTLLLGAEIDGTRRLPDQSVDYARAVQGRVWFVRYQASPAKDTVTYLFGYRLSNQPTLPPVLPLGKPEWDFTNCPVKDWKFQSSQGTLECREGQGLFLNSGGQKTSLTLSGPPLKAPPNATGLEIIFLNYPEYDFHQLQIFSDLTLASSASAQTPAFQQPFELASDGKPREYHFYLPLPPGNAGNWRLTFNFNNFRTNILWQRIAVRFITQK